MPEPSTRTVTPRRSQLLVNVRSLDEAKIVAAAGVDVIDFKEPRRGPLAPVDAKLWKVAAETLPDAVLSAARGESDTAMNLASRVPTNFHFASGLNPNKSDPKTNHRLAVNRSERLRQNCVTAVIRFCLRFRSTNCSIQLVPVRTSRASAAVTRVF